MKDENLEPSLHSAKAFADFSQKKANNAKKKESDTIKASQLESEKVALLKESNELATKALANANLRSEKESALHESKSTDVVDIKPNLFGIGVNLNETWRRIKNWLSK